MIIERKIEDYTRVTEVLYPFSGLKEKEIDPDILDNAAIRGKVVHKLCDYMAFSISFFESEMDQMIRNYARNDEHFFKEKEIVENCLKSFEKWMEGKKFILTPARFYDEDLKITGECDLVYQGSNGLVLTDLKLPITESHTWLLQGSAYSYMAKKIGYEIQEIEFVRLSRTAGKAKISKYTEDFPLFKSHLDAYRYSFKNIITPTNLDYL